MVTAISSDWFWFKGSSKSIVAVVLKFLKKAKGRANGREGERKKWKKNSQVKCVRWLSCDIAKDHTTTHCHTQFDLVFFHFSLSQYVLQSVWKIVRPYLSDIFLWLSVLHSLLSAFYRVLASIGWCLLLLLRIFHFWISVRGFIWSRVKSKEKNNWCSHHLKAFQSLKAYFRPGVVFFLLSESNADSNLIFFGSYVCIFCNAHQITCVHVEAVAVKAADKVTPN